MVFGARLGLNEVNDVAILNLRESQTRNMVISKRVVVGHETALVYEALCCNCNASFLSGLLSYCEEKLFEVVDGG